MQKLLFVLGLGVLLANEAFAQRDSEYFSAWVYMMHDCVEYSIVQEYNTQREKYLATRSEKAWKKMKQLEAVYIECQIEGKLR